MLKIFAVRVNSVVIRGILFILETCIHCRDLDVVMNYVLVTHKSQYYKENYVSVTHESQYYKENYVSVTHESQYCKENYVSVTHESQYCK